MMLVLLNFYLKCILNGVAFNKLNILSKMYPIEGGKSISLTKNRIKSHEEISLNIED